MGKVITLRQKEPRISEKIRKAVHLMARSGLTQPMAAEQAGLSRQGCGKALERPEVWAVLERARESLIAAIDHLRARGRIVGLEVALDLALNLPHGHGHRHRPAAMSSTSSAPNCASSTA